MRQLTKRNFSVNSGKGRNNGIKALLFCTVFFFSIVWKGMKEEVYAQLIATGGKISYLDTSGKPTSSPVFGGYTVHVFDSSGVFNVILGVDSIEYLVVAGGGGCANQAGGGAGGVLRNNALNYKVTAGDTFHVTVGEGGAVGANGKNSSFGTITAIGGGTGRASGGSGGGGFPISGQQPPGKGIVGQGNDGGSGYWYIRAMTSGGGGGAGAAGVYQNAGGGVLSSITGIATYYAGGGGGYKAGYGPTKKPASPGIGGAGGGGDYGKSGVANTGGGGGGAGGKGGSGVVILRYRSYVCLAGTITPDTAICPESSITLQAGGGLYYKWMKNLDTTSIGNTSSLTVSPSNNTNYTVKISNDSCFVTKTVKVSIKNFSGIKVAGKTVVCTGDSTQLSVMGGVTYLWSTGTTTKSISVSPLADTTYSVTVGNGCTDTTIEVPITMFSSSSVKLTGDTLVCKGISTTLVATGGPGYKWSTGATTDIITVGPPQDTTYKVIVTNGKCIDSASIFVRVAPLPVANAGPDTMVCGGNNLVQLKGTGSSVNGTINYSWSPAYLLHDSTISNPLATLQDTTTDFILTISDGTCSKTDTVTMTISNISAGFSGDTSICSGDSAALTIDGGIGATYLWSTGDTTSTTKLKPLQDSLLSVVVTNGGTCLSTILINVGTYPLTNAGSDTSVCVGASVQLMAEGGETGSLYHWIGAGLSDTTISNPIATPTGTTNYIATITDGICSTSDTVIITVYSLPTVQVTPKTKELNTGENTTLTANGASSYTWTPGTGLSDSTISNPIAQPTATITYIVTGTDDNGCSNKDTVNITVNKLICDPYIPNAFSPNSDGQNDLLKIYGDCIKTLEKFSIYDRWGEKVFETTDINTGWDGTYKGKAMNTGVFVYYLTVIYTDGEEVSKKGNISLIR